MPPQLQLDSGLKKKLLGIFIPRPANCGARVYRSTNQTGIASGGFAYLVFDTEREDTGWLTDDAGVTRGFWRDDGNANWQRKLFAQKAGNHVITGHAEISTNANGIRTLVIRLNGVTYIAADGRNACQGQFATSIGIATKWWMEVGDYVELGIYQNSGVDLIAVSAEAYSPEFTIVRVP